MAKKFSDQIREALNKCGLTRYRVWKLTGIDQTALMRFARGDAGLSIENIDRLAEVIGLNVTTDRPKLSPGATAARESSAATRKASRRKTTSRRAKR